ncbi:MAG: chitobiase/beta-hexosaminidase C-terminal domain-containing protein [Bacteroidales bacterium]|nr:chitobiase/beta-hexosaminidase C-terminal domain-containing protein [Bacteroidales bacterium]
MDTDTSLSIGKSANENGDALEVFAYGIILMPKTNEGFNNIGQTGANPTGYVIDLDKLSTSNYDFSPCMSAALNVSGNSGSGNSNSGNSGSGNQTQTVTAPVISGTSPFADTTQVTLTEPEGARAYYTTDGSTPTAESTLYTEPFTLSNTTTVKAIAIKDGVSSSVASKTFTKSSGDNGGTTE